MAHPNQVLQSHTDKDSRLIETLEEVQGENPQVRDLCIET